MSKIDWHKKLTSRKFWAAAAGFVTAILSCFGIASNTVEQIACIVTAGATLIAYIIGEGLVDASAAGGAAVPTGAGQASNPQ